MDYICIFMITMTMNHSLYYSVKPPLVVFVLRLTISSSCNGCINFAEFQTFWNLIAELKINQMKCSTNIRLQIRLKKMLRSFGGLSNKR